MRITQYRLCANTRLRAHSGHIKHLRYSLLLNRPVLWPEYRKSFQRARTSKIFKSAPTERWLDLLFNLMNRGSRPSLPSLSHRQKQLLANRLLTQTQLINQLWPRLVHSTTQRRLIPPKILQSSRAEMLM